MSIWGLYLRLSKDDLRGGKVSEANSIEGQRRDGNAYIRRVDPDATINEYAEEAYISASKGLERPEYVRMLEAIAAGELDHIVAAKQDRFTRDRDVEFGELKGLAQRHGVQVHAADSGSLFDSHDRELASGIRAEFSQFEAKLIGSRTKRGLETRREGGEWTGRRQFGYFKGGEVNPEQAEHIRRAYDKILNQGGSARDVFEHWRKTGVLTVNARQWNSVDRVASMLKNPALAGLVAHKGEVLDVEAKWSPIVTPEEQARLKVALSANRKGQRGYGRRKPRRRWLSGLALCGNPACDLMAMVSQNPGNGRPYWYLHCDRRRGGCGNRTRGPELENVVRYVAFALLRSTPAPLRLVEEFDETELKEIERQIKEVRAALEGRTMSAADAVPVLQSLRSQLAEQEQARDQFASAQRAADDWHSTEFGKVLMGDGDSIRRLIDNVRVLPDHAGVVIEGTNGVSMELTGEQYARAGAGLDDTNKVQVVINDDHTWRFTTGEPEGEAVTWRRTRPAPVRRG